MGKNYTVKEWQENIRNGMRFQQKHGNSDKWNRYREYYRHNFGRPGYIPVNIVFSLLRSMTAQVYFHNPRITITPRRPGMERELNARILQELDNWLIGEVGVKDEMKKLIGDSFFCGIANGLSGYDSMFGFSPQNLENDSSYSLTQFGKGGRRIEYNSNISPGMPWFLRARPEDVIWPWGCTSAKEAEWVAIRTIRPLDDLREDKKYKIPDGLLGSLTPLRTDPDGGISYDSLTGSGYQEGVNNKHFVELFQVHDARTGQILAVTLGDGGDKFLREPQPDELQIDGLPVDTISFNPDPEYIYGVPDVKVIEPQLLELNEIRTQAMKHRRIDLVKFFYKDGAISETDLQKLTDEAVMGGIKIATDTNLRDSVLSFTPGVSGILQDLTLAGEIVRSDVRETVGFSRNSGGEFQGKTHISAQETKQVFQAHSIRLDERRDMLADTLTNVVRRFNQMIFTYWDAERVAKITGPDGARWWIKYTGQQIKDEYDITITPEEGTNMDTATKFEMGMRAADAWAKMNAGAIAQGMPVPQEIQRLLFGQFAGSGLDIDRLLAQSAAIGTAAQQALGQQGQSQGNPVGVGQLAGAMQGGR